MSGLPDWLPPRRLTLFGDVTISYARPSGGEAAGRVVNDRSTPAVVPSELVATNR
jgi:hypothetical protein